MFDQILSLVKDQITKTVGGISGVPADKQSDVVHTTTSSLMDGLKQFASPDKLTALLGGGSGASKMTGSLSSGVVDALTSKVGLKPALATSIAGAAIPAVMSLLQKNVGDPSKPGFNVTSLLGALTGGGGGIIDKIAGFFKGK